MGNNLHISNIFPNFGTWIGRSCKPSDKGKLTAFPRFTYCQHNVIKNVSNMLKFEELPEINSERWLSLENLEGEEWRDIDCAKGSYMISNYGRIKSLERARRNRYSINIWKETIRRVAYDKNGYPTTVLLVNCKKVYKGSIHRLVALTFIPNTENKPQVDHINTIVKDNRVCNLRWVTCFENAHNSITMKKVREFQNSRIGHHHSEETRNKIREKLKNGASSGFKQVGELSVRSIPVIQLSLNGEFVKEWPCARQACLIYGFHITDCCRGKRSQCGGYKWMYKSDFEQLKFQGNERKV